MQYYPIVVRDNETTRKMAKEGNLPRAYCAGTLNPDGDDDDVGPGVPGDALSVRDSVVIQTEIEECSKALREVFKYLTKKAKTPSQLITFALRGLGWTDERIGEKFNVTKCRVNQLQQASLRALRRYSSDDSPELMVELRDLLKTCQGNPALIDQLRREYWSLLKVGVAQSKADQFGWVFKRRERLKSN